MRILVVGAGGVGDAVARIAARRSFFELMVIADYDLAKAQASVVAAEAAGGTGRFVAAFVDASSADSVAALAREHGITHVLNAVDPRFVMGIFDGAFAAGADYLDMAMSLSHPHAERPYGEVGVKLGDEQFAKADEWVAAGRLALVGMGVEPGLSDVFARYAADHLFSEIDELGTRDGANLVVTNEAGEEIFAPSFSIWTTIEECLNPPVIFEAGKGWFTTPPFSEPEVFDFPEGIGPVECVNVEHEEVLLMPRWVDAKRVTFKYGLGDEFIGVLKTLHALGLDRTAPVKVKGVEVSPRDVVAAVLPDPATIGPRMTGKTCAGLYVTGKGKDGHPRRTYLYHVVDNQWAMANYGAQCVVWQTAINPVVALELLATGVWKGSGVLGPEAFDAVPFLELLGGSAPVGYDSAWGMEEK
ncbi:saccharopine dehydrogenase C-terminal domain-containing protein [Propionicimonas sp.]|uniref:saccharopine dehydrogenase family protein n=1 Tax=Propionicimonas sp. TaxID=1955623 RepID=UPI00184F4971|nr:saccharopine dehydrogenase C-terminal domain-containing protein [Propionicimonas sp.]MBU3976430.1 saccharopine dehydrogenase NADP-binding domain-containing protein [Actinomycetota bacterium]MBA3020270.1 ATP-binding protein [Propionicimonas sp.]MBU3986057.1 saccharopine dehydrogenase NADP-binding domain-containing protein [Actinomycetota bacterium]MBU4007574.1 saccharopine dehydrogenase NADP-binding domain-containing protein [Actinomycetota bacterium]MBU4064355.1 saccharopine dehydrogenase N